MQPGEEDRAIAYRVTVNHDLCEGHGRCQDTAPNVFELRDDDLSYVLVERPGQELRLQVEKAVRLCPRQAIDVVEED